MAPSSHPALAKGSGQMDPLNFGADFIGRMIPPGAVSLVAPTGRYGLSLLGPSTKPLGAELDMDALETAAFKGVDKRAGPISTGPGDAVGEATGNSRSSSQN